MKYIVIIPARGGSKRFPGKNIYPLDGKPLIAHSIEYAKKFDVRLNIYVTTDSEAIAATAKEYGAEIIERPIELAGDYVSTAKSLQHAAEELVKSNVEFDYVILFQPTNPLRPADMLANAIKIIETADYDSLMSVSPSYEKLGKIIDNNFVPWNYQYRQRSQDMEPLYYENGLLYISKKELILKELITGDKMHPMVVDHIYGKVDIDTIEDLKYAEYLIARNL